MAVLRFKNYLFNEDEVDVIGALLDLEVKKEAASSARDVSYWIILKELKKAGKTKEIKLLKAYCKGDKKTRASMSAGKFYTRASKVVDFPAFSTVNVALSSLKKKGVVDQYKESSKKILYAVTLDFMKEVGKSRKKDYKWKEGKSVLDIDIIPEKKKP